MARAGCSPHSSVGTKLNFPHSGAWKASERGVTQSDKTKTRPEVSEIHSHSTVPGLCVGDLQPTLVFYFFLFLYYYFLTKIVTCCFI